MFMTIREEFQWEMFPRWQGNLRNVEEDSGPKGLRPKVSILRGGGE